MTTSIDKQTQEALRVKRALKLALEALEDAKKNHGLVYVTELCTIREALAQAPTEQEQPAQQQYTYASTQATMCAGCGEHKHTPLRIDAMGGYVCLTCIDKELGSLLGEFGYPQPAQQQEPVSDALHFAQWTAAKKDLSDYILVGSLSLAGIEDGEYGTSEIDPLDNTIEALQEKLVTGPDHKKVPLLAYIGALNNTSPPANANAGKPWGGLTEVAIWNTYKNLWMFHPAEEPRLAGDILKFARAIEAKLKEKNGF